MPPTSDHEQFFYRFDPTSSDDYHAYTPNTRGRRINTPNRAGRNRHMNNSVRAEAYLDRYAMTGTITRLQDRHSEEGYGGYCSPADGYGSHHTQICHHFPLLNSPSLLHAIAILFPHQMAETWAIEALIQTAIPRRNMNEAAGQAVPRRNVWVPPRLLIATYIMVAAIPVSVSIHDRTSPAGGHRHGSHFHCTESNTASYASGQSRSSRGHSSSHSHSLSHTANTTDAHQPLLNSISSVSASKKLLRSNAFPNDESNYDEESGTGLDSLPANNHAAMHASASCTS